MYDGIVRALVVDDSTTVQRLMDLTLRPLGMDIDLVGTGEAAVRLAAERSYDIIFLDVMLPGIDGYRVCKTIKGSKHTRNTPVVMLTSKDSAFDKVRGIMAGTDVYLTKPLDSTEIVAVVRRYLRVAAPRAQYAP
jgi:twitching motility two-component system response regulator PilG